MIFLYFLEWIFIAIFLVMMGTQVIYPLLDGQQTFPLFRHRKLEVGIDGLREQLVQAELAEEKKRLGRELNAKRKEIK